MIVYKKCKTCSNEPTEPNGNIFTYSQRQKLANHEQAQKEIKSTEKRLLEISELEKTEELTQEKQMLESQLQQARSKLLTEAEKEALLVEIAELDELVYVVDDNSELARKVMEAAPYFDFVLDGNSELVDIIPLPKPVVIPEPTEIELTQQAITDLELTTIEQGQQITALELLVLEGTKNV